MDLKKKKYFISIYISFIAVIISVITVIWSTYSFKTDIKLFSVFVAVFASILGVFLSIFYKKLTTRKYRSKIYISFSQQDIEIAKKIRNTLINERFILNIDEKNIQIGENIKQVISSEIKSSSIFIVLLSQNSIKSEFLKYEIEYANKNNKKVLPVLLDKNITIPKELKDIKYADFTTNSKEAMSQLIKALKSNLAE